MIIIRHSYSVTAQLGIGGGGRGLQSLDASLDFLHGRARLLSERTQPVGVGLRGVVDGVQGARTQRGYLEDVLAHASDLCLNGSILHVHETFRVVQCKGRVKDAPQLGMHLWVRVLRSLRGSWGCHCGGHSTKAPNYLQLHVGPERQVKFSMRANNSEQRTTYPDGLESISWSHGWRMCTV